MKKKENTYSILIKSLKEYMNNKDDLNLIEKAYNYAFNCHKGQFRLSGEDYIEHPLSVALILTEISSDATTIAASLLHDVIEDCGVTYDEIKTNFGESIAFLVEGVTEINKLSFSADSDATILTERKILVGITKDVRVIIIKLADRLHNLRTMWVLPQEKQKKKAKETLEILTPIAHRLGMGHIKSELEDLSLRYLKPEVYSDIVEKLNTTTKEREAEIAEMIKNLSEVLNSHGISHEIKGRAKGIYSIYNKLSAGKRYSDIYDLYGIRIFVNKEQDCYVAIGLIHAKYKPIPKRFKDYIAMPKTNMYQSIHTTVFGVNGYMFEIQIRTHEMDMVAEHGIASHWSYKEKTDSIQNAMEQKLQFFRSIIELNSEKSSPEDFVNTVRDEVLNNTIYVYTPKGDVIELPSGSTPIDFAYKLHTELGHKLVGSLVNNAIVPLNHELQSGDIVKINTSNASKGPSKEWIGIVKTTSAREKIKTFFNKIDKDEYLSHGEEELLDTLRKKKINFDDLFVTNLNLVLKETRCETLDDLYIAIGSKKVGTETIINIINGNNKSKEDMLKELLDRQSPKKHEVIKNDVLVTGIDNIKVNIASCCKPIPGDEIIGYITKTNGIIVHRLNCYNVNTDERIIDVSWNKKEDKKYSTDLLIYSSDSATSIVDIVNKCSFASVSIDYINTVSKTEEVIFKMGVLLESKEKLDKLLISLTSLPYIKKVERLVR